MFFCGFNVQFDVLYSVYCIDSFVGGLSLNRSTKYMYYSTSEVEYQHKTRCVKNRAL